jgi:hypothetical protein
MASSSSSGARVAVATTQPPPPSSGSSGSGSAGAPLHPYKSLGIYTFKGGTGKTTTTIHVAGSLAAMGHRVLVIDFDPQCNLTDFLNEGDSAWHDVNMDDYQQAAKSWLDVEGLVSEGAGEAGGAGGAGGAAAAASSSLLPKIEQDTMSPEDLASMTAPKLSNFIDKERQNNGRHTVYKLFEPVFQAVNSDRMFHHIETDEDLLAEVNWVFAGKTAGGDPTPLYGNFFLLRGSTKMAELGGQMGTALGNALSSPSNTPFLGTCHHMMAALAQKYKLDFIVVDMSPSSGALNEAMAMSCDYLLPPANADSYSAMSAFGMLTENLPKWFKRKKAIIDYQKMFPAENDLFKWKVEDKYPKLLPFMVSRYERRTPGVLNADAMRWMISVEDFVNDFCLEKTNPFVGVSAASIPDPALIEAGRSVIGSLQRVEGKMTMALAPQNEKIYCICQTLGRTLPELTLDMCCDEYPEMMVEFDPMDPTKQAKANAFRAELEELQGRYRQLTEWITAVAQQDDTRWKGLSGKDAKKRKRLTPMAMLLEQGWYPKYKYSRSYGSPWSKPKKKFLGYVSPDKKYIYQSVEACQAHIADGAAKAEEIDKAVPVSSKKTPRSPSKKAKK